jgi:hypothetical protein
MEKGGWRGETGDEAGTGGGNESKTSEKAQEKQESNRFVVRTSRRLLTVDCKKAHKGTPVNLAVTRIKDRL